MGKRLTRIYTRSGDDGSTGLTKGKRVDKDCDRIEVMGDIDELNSLLGVLIAGKPDEDITGYLLNIQHRLFDIGAELSMPGTSIIQSEYVIRLEELINTFNEDLKPLEEFVLPGGTMTGAVCHLARSVCRRTERHMVKLGRKEYLNPETLVYINRLSDLLFVFARVLTLQNNGKEVYWNKNRLKQSV